MHHFSPDIARTRIDDLTHNARRARLVAAAHVQRRNRQRRALAIRLWR
jgi:hypothetical protein